MATTNNIQASDGNKIQKSGGLVVVCGCKVASVRKNELFRIQLDKTKYYI